MRIAPVAQGSDQGRIADCPVDWVERTTPLGIAVSSVATLGPAWMSLTGTPAAARVGAWLGAGIRCSGRSLDQMLTGKMPRILH